MAQPRTYSWGHGRQDSTSSGGSWRRRSSSSSVNSSSDDKSTSPSPRPSTTTKKTVAPKDLSGNWRATARSLPPVKSPAEGITGQQKPSFEDLEMGTVFHLPEPSKESRLHKQILGSNQSPWGHPAVALRKWMEDGEDLVAIRLCTTFGGRSIEEAKAPHLRKLFMLAENGQYTQPHGDTRLATTTSGSFAKRTYINLSPRSEYIIEYKYLATFTSQVPIQFDAASVERMRWSNP